MFSCDTSTTNTHSAFVELHNGKYALIRKTTAVWLFQEGYRMSSDRLFRVRCKQPYSSNVSHNQHTESANPIISHSIQIGEMCVFKQNQGWAIGKVLQFSRKDNVSPTIQGVCC